MRAHLEPTPGAPARETPRVDPLGREHRLAARAIALWSIAFVAGAVPMFVPRARPSVPVPGVPSPPAAGPHPVPVPLDPASFDAPVWLTRLEAPAPPEPKPPPPIPVRPLPRLELLGIERGTGREGQSVCRAVLYDPDSKRVLVVRAGDRLEPSARTISAITPTAITIADGPTEHTLTLRAPSPTPPAPSREPRGAAP